LQSLTFRAQDPRRTQRAGEFSLTSRSLGIFDAAFEKRRAEFIIGPLSDVGEVGFLSVYCQLPRKKQRSASWRQKVRVVAVSPRRYPKLGCL